MTKQTKRRSPRSEARADWHPIGCEVPPPLFEALLAEAKENGVPQAVVQRWALETYLHDRLEAAE